MHKKLSKLLLVCSKKDMSHLRIWGIGVAVLISFGILLARFYKLQVIDHEVYVADMRATTERQIEITAPRGEIYDRYGKPLAVNQAVSNLYYTSNLKLSDTEINTLLLQLIDLLENNGDTFIDEVPISLEEPFEYTGGQTTLNQFTYQIPYNNEAKRKILLTYTAEEMISYLQDMFQIPNHLAKTKVRQLIALRSQIYSCAYRQYEDVLLARHLSDATISYLKENDEQMPNLVVHAQPERFYPLGSMTSNVIGYTSGLTHEQYDTLKNKGYSLFDVMGQMGIEKSFEDRLRGINGTATIEVDNMGRAMRTISETESVKGQDIYLTIDASLQEAIYHAVEKRLSEALILKLKAPETYGITGQDMLISLISCHNLDLNKESSEMPYLNRLKKRLETAYIQIDPLMRSKVSEEELIIDWLSETPMNEAILNEVLLALNEENVLRLDEEDISYLTAGKSIDLTTLFISHLAAGIIVPGQMAIDPFSAVAAMVDVKTGEVLSLVDYPSYDNNQMVGQFNTYLQLINGDARSLLWQRSLKTLKAPGSTFKMVTALAGLEEGYVTKDTVIEDTGIYKDAGKPYPKCWYYTNTGKGHGPLNLQEALGASCNYYFYEVAHRLGGEHDGISTLGKYMEKLGLTEKTGIELEEESPYASIPDEVVKNKVNHVISSLINLDQESQEENIADEIIYLNKNFILTDTSLTSLEDVNALYGEQLKQYVIPLLQETLEGYYKELLTHSYSVAISYMTANQDKIRESVINEILGNKDLTTRNETAYTAFYHLIEEGVMQSLDVEIQKVLEQLPSDTLLDAYEKALRKTYRQLIREEGKSEVARIFNAQIEDLSGKEDELREKLLVKVRQNLLNAIVNNLLYGVELNWTEGITVRTAIGQGYNAFSPLQVLRYVAALANGETLEPLTLIQGGNKDREKALNLSANNIQAIQEGMLTVTAGEEGTAKGQFDNLPVKVAAKTGTAEEGSHEHNYIVAFAPYEKPEVALIVAIYNADGLGRYSTLIANDMLSSYFGLQNKQENITLVNTWME